MTVIVTDPKTLFIHVPKAGGTSIQQWLFNNCNGKSAKGTYGKHCPHSLIKEEKDWFSFGVVRNPWDRLVSAYFYEMKVAKFRLKCIEENRPEVKPQKQGWTKKFNMGTLSRLEKGFGHFVVSKRYGPCEHTQCFFLNGVDRVLRLENIENDFKKIQQRFNCFVPLAVENTTEHKNYRKYYTKKTEKIVREYFAEDIEKFSYEF